MAPAAMRPYPQILPPDTVYRVAFGDDPLALRPWGEDHARRDGRWDDPCGEYRVLYTSKSEEGALREKLQRFCPSSQIGAALAALETEADDALDFDVVPLSWLADYSISKLRVHVGDCVPACEMRALDAYYDRSHRRLRAGDLLAVDGESSRELSRSIWLTGVAGIAATSKLATDIHGYVFFEDPVDSGKLRATIRCVETRALRHDDPVLMEVVNQLRLRIEGAEEHRADDLREAWIYDLERQLREIYSDLTYLAHKDKAGFSYAMLAAKDWAMTLALLSAGPQIGVLVVVRGGKSFTRTIRADYPIADFVQEIVGGWSEPVEVAGEASGADSGSSSAD